MRYNDFQSYSSKKAEATQEKNDIRLNIVDGSIRYQVKSDLWRNPKSLNFPDFVNWLREHRTSRQGE
jgi:hypothetical protein